MSDRPLEWFRDLINGDNRPQGLNQDCSIAQYGAGSFETGTATRLLYSTISSGGTILVPITRQDKDYSEVVYTLDSSMPVKAGGYHLLNNSNFQITVRNDTVKKMMESVDKILSTLSNNTQVSVSGFVQDYIPDNQTYEGVLMVDVVSLPQDNQLLPAALVWYNESVAAGNRFQNFTEQVNNRSWCVAIIGDDEEGTISGSIRDRLIGKQENEFSGLITYNSGGLEMIDETGDLRVWVDNYADWNIIEGMEEV